MLIDFYDIIFMIHEQHCRLDKREKQRKEKGKKKEKMKMAVCSRLSEKYFFAIHFSRSYE